MKTYITRVIAMLLLVMGMGGQMWAETVKYTISSKNTLTTTGTAPSGSSATIVETYGTSCQMTSGNSQTLTLKGYDGYKITQIKLSMHSNSSRGAGKLLYSTNAGTSYTYIVGTSSAGVVFSNSSWHGSWSTSYVDVTKSVDITATSSDLIIKIEATANSLYCQSYEITYEAVGGGSTPTVSLNKSSTSIVAGSTETLTAETTNPSEAAVTWSTSNSSVATVSGGTVTAVAPGTATITAALSSNPSIKATCAVTVTAIPRTISITTTDMDLTVGGSTQTRTGTLSAGSGTITYRSSDDDVATVSSTGEVTAVGAGSCTITASVPAVGNYAAASASYTVNVNDPNNMSGTINFNSSGTVKGTIKINGASASGDDNLDNNWSVTTVGTSSFTPQPDYCQVGSSSNPATSITFTMTLENDVTFKNFSAKFGGFSSTAGTITLKVGNTTVGTGSLSGASDVTVTANSGIPADGRTLTVTVTGISRGVKCYYISYNYSNNTKLPTTLSWNESAPVGDLVVGATHTRSASADRAGTITYSSSDATIASVNSSGVVTANAAGSATITASIESTSTHNGASLSYDVTVVAPTISLNKNSTTLLVGGTEVLSATTTNAGGATINWSTSDGTKVSLSGSGNTRTITGVAVGSSTITASITVNGHTYQATCEVSVNASQQSPDKYELVTDASTLAAGDEILIAYVSGETAKAMSATQKSNNRDAVAVTLNSDDTLTPGSDAQVITLEKSGNYFLFNVGGGYLYAASSGNNYLRTETTADDNAKAAISISSNNATITFQGSNTRNLLRYNSSSNLFSCYASGQTAPQIYRKEESGTAPTFTPSSIANQNLVVGATYETAAISVNSGGTLSATSSDEDVATVVWNGTTNKATVTAVSAGETTIKIKTAKNGEYKSGELSFTVTVVAPTIELNKTSAGLEIGGTETLTATLTNADGATVDWTTSDDAIVSISGTGASRTITAMAAGTATITASINVNGYDYEATCEVTVQAHLEEGDYVIEHDGRYMKNEIVSDRLGSDDNCNFTTSGKAINPDPSIVWHIAKSGDYYTIYNAAEEKYAASTGSDNRAQLLASGTDDKAKWSVDGGTGETWDFVNKYNESNGKNSHLRYNPGYGFACYAESFSERLILHPVVTGPWIMLNKNTTGLDLGWTEVLTATTNHPEATVTWTSSDPAKVSVSADGAKCTITGVAAGEATITASITVSGTVYSETCHVKVGPVKVYQKVTSASGLEAGKNYILVYESGTSARLMGSVNKHGGSTYYGESLRGYTITDNKIAVYDESVNVLTLSEGTPSGYAFETSIENQYLSWTSGNSLSTSATKAGSSSWELTFAASGDLTITNVATSSRELHYNLGSPRFACYDKSGQKAVALYVEVPHYAFRVYSGSSMDYENVLVTDAAPALTDNQVAVLIKTLTSAELEAVPVPIKTADRVVINGEAASIVVTDKQAGVSTNNGYTNFYAPAAFTTTSKVSYTRSGISGFNSVCLPFSYTVAQACSASMFGTDAEIYVLGSVTDGAVNFVKMTEGTVAAGTPVIVKTSTTTSWNINELSGTFAVNGAAPVEDPKTDGTRKATLKGAYQTLTINTGDASENGHSYYKLNSTGDYFVKVPANAKVYPFRVYLDVETLSGSPAPSKLSFNLIDGGSIVMDPSVSIADVTTLVNMLLGKGNVTTTDDGIHYVRPTDGQQMSADWDGDGQVSISDVTKLVNKVLKK